MIVYSKIVAVFLCVSVFFNSGFQSDREFLDRQIELIELGRRIYLTFDIQEDSNRKNKKVLIDSYDLFVLEFPELIYDESFASHLKKELRDGVLIVEKTRKFKKYLVSTNCFNALENSRISKQEVLDKYFDSSGVPMYSSWSKKKLNAALSYLIHNEVLVHGGEYNEHSVSISNL